MEHQAKSTAGHAPARAQAERTSEPARSLGGRRPAAAQHPLAQALDNGPRSVAQRELAETLDSSPRVAALRQLSQAMNYPPRTIVQRKQISEVRHGESVTESPARNDDTGLPDQLKSGVEALSGNSLDSVEVHYNSSRPAQGRVKPTLQMKGIPVGGDDERERAADALGEKTPIQGIVQRMYNPFGKKNNNNNTFNNNNSFNNNYSNPYSNNNSNPYANNSNIYRNTRNSNNAAITTTNNNNNISNTYNSASNNNTYSNPNSASNSNIYPNTRSSTRNNNYSGNINSNNNTTSNSGYSNNINSTANINNSSLSSNNINYSTNNTGNTSGAGNYNSSNINYYNNTNTFTVNSINFTQPGNYTFTPMSALEAIQPIPHGEANRQTGLSSSSGVEIGNVGSYRFIQYLEKAGDQLTGDHQPSGAAIKENIRQKLHNSLPHVLTREQARNAYNKAITVVMTDVWHKMYSRTFGGRNTQTQITQDSSDLAAAAIKDWESTVTGLLAGGLDEDEIQAIWNALDAARMAFFSTGKAQAGNLGT